MQIRVDNCDDRIVSEMNPFETCPNCGAPAPKRTKIKVQVAGSYVGEFEGYSCNKCGEEFLAPETLSKAQTQIKNRGLFGIALRQFEFPQQMFRLDDRSSTAYTRAPTSTGKRDSLPSILKPEMYEFFSSHTYPDRVPESQSSKMTNVLTE